MPAWRSRCAAAGPDRPAPTTSAASFRPGATSATPTLGVCLGHQALVRAYGGEIGQARALLHGKASRITHDGRGVYAGLPAELDASNYARVAGTAVYMTGEPSTTPPAFSSGLSAAFSGAIPAASLGALDHSELALSSLDGQDEAALRPAPPLRPASGSPPFRRNSSYGCIRWRNRRPKRQTANLR